MVLARRPGRRSGCWTVNVSVPRSIMVTMSSSPASQAGPSYREWSEQLLTHWDDHQSSQERFWIRRGNRKGTRQQFALVYGLVCQAHESARGYLAALKVVPVTAATPMLRACYEQSITAHWVAQVDDAYLGVGKEYMRLRSNLATNLRESAVQHFRDSAAVLEAANWGDLEELETYSVSPARRFDLLCEDLSPGGKEAYLYYRVMSMESHASPTVVDEWLELTGGTEQKLLLNPVSGARSEESWLYLLAASLIWAGRALDFFDGHRTRRDYLRSMAREVGVVPQLELSAAYHARIRQAQQKARKRAPC